MIAKPKKRVCKRCELKRLKLIEAQQLGTYSDRMMRSKDKKKVLVK